MGIIDINLIGLGHIEAERIQSIVMSLLSTKGYFQNSNKLHDSAHIHNNRDILEYMILTTIEY